MGRSSSRSFVFLFLPEERFLFFQMEKFFHSSNFRKMENDKNRSKRWTEIFQRPGYYGINSCCSKKYEITYCSKFASSIASTDSLYANWRILFNKQTESREEWNRVVTMRFHEETSVSKKAVTKRWYDDRTMHRSGLPVEASARLDSHALAAASRQVRYSWLLDN